MYATKRASKDAETAMRKSIPSPMGHTVTGYDCDFHPVIETSSEMTAVAVASVIHLRIKQMTGKYMYRTIIAKP